MLIQICCGTRWYGTSAYRTPHTQHTYVWIRIHNWWHWKWIGIISLMYVSRSHTHFLHFFSVCLRVCLCSYAKAIGDFFYLLFAYHLNYSEAWGKTKKTFTNIVSSCVCVRVRVGSRLCLRLVVAGASWHSNWFETVRLTISLFLLRAFSHSDRLFTVNIRFYCVLKSYLLKPYRIHKWVPMTCTGFWCTYINKILSIILFHLNVYA